MNNPFSTPRQVFFTPLKDIAAFHEKFGLGQPEAKQRLSEDEWELKAARLTEEAEEFSDAAFVNDEADALDALVDIVYIALGIAYRRGWNFQEAWMRVHAANMQKERGTDQTSKYGSSFDIVKPKGWIAPTLHDLV